jgi:hypothetical protein
MAVYFYSYIIGVFSAPKDKFQAAIVSIKNDSFSDDFSPTQTRGVRRARVPARGGD